MSKAKQAALVVEQVTENGVENAVEVAKSVNPVKHVGKVRNLGRFVPKVVTRNSGRAALIVAKNSPTILFVAGTVGIVGTAVAASKATLRLEEVLEENLDLRAKARQALDDERINYSVRDYNRDMAILYFRAAGRVVKLYGPTIVLGVATVAALAGSHNILQRRNASLTAAYVALDKGFRAYDARVKQEFGEAKAAELRYGTEETTILEEKAGKDGKIVTKAKTVKRVGPEGASIYARFFDEYCPNWKTDPQLNLFFLKCQQTYANDVLHTRGHLFLNEVYDMIGLPRSTAGQIVGWVLSPDGDNFVDFGLTEGTNERVRDFVNGREGSLLVDFNVDGPVYNLIEKD